MRLATLAADHPWVAYAPIAVLACVGALVSWDAARKINDLERRQVLQEFRNAASDRVLMVQRELELALGVVRDIGSFFDASARVGRREYREFVGPALGRYPSILALEWIPKVEAARRREFILRARRSFPRFRITERDAGGALVNAVSRPVHFPVLYVQPYRSNKSRLGLDLAADSEVLRELQEAEQAGGIRVSSRIPIGQDEDERFGFVARLPVYRIPEGRDDEPEADGQKMTAMDRQRQLRGFAAGMFDIGAIVESALENLSPIGIDMVIRDLGANGGNDYLYRHVSRKRSGGEQAILVSADSEVFRQQFALANRRWQIECTPVPGYFQLDTRRGVVVLAGGWAFTLLLTIYLSTLVGRAAKVKRLVAERTRQLTAANQALNKEIGERIDTQIALQMLNDTLEQRVEERTAEAQQHIQELEQFAYVTSHDLKAPLRSIANLATWLEEDLADKHTEASREQLRLLRDRVQRMDALIEGLLEYSRIGRSEPVIDTFAVDDLLADVLDSLPLPSGFRVEIGPGMPVLRTERLLLYQVFSNLIGNAIKHHDGSGSGRVRIEVEEAGDRYRFRVADDGPGIAPEYHHKVFMMFQTLEARDHGNSTGIGLALVKKIVQEHGGAIHLESSPGQGAVFHFTWPKGG